MAKFWRAIRNVIHNIPVPGIGVSINDGKAIAGALKNDPEGRVTITGAGGGTPSTEAVTDRVTVQSATPSNTFVWVAAGLAALLIFTDI